MNDLLDLQIMDYLERRARLVCSDRSNDLDCMDEIDFKSRYRLSKHTAESLLQLLDDKLTSQSNRNHALSSAEKLCTALRFFASGPLQLLAGDLARVSQASACRAINDVATALAELRPNFIRLPANEMERHEICQAFYEDFGMPGVYLALDCTHIPIMSPGGVAPEVFRNRKGIFSLNVQTVSDDTLAIRDIVACWPGSTHDSTIFDNSRLRAVMETQVPPNYHLLGDNGYSCRSYLLTPFLEPRNIQETRYNEAHIRARNVVERSYGLWKRRFACLSIPLRSDLQNVMKIIVATAVLHNIAIRMDDDFDLTGAPANDDDEDDPAPPDHIAGVAKRRTIVSQFFNN